MRARARSQVRDEQRQAHEHKQPGAAGLSCDVHERCVHVGKASPVPPDELRQIHQDRRQHAGNQAREYRRKQDIPLRVLDFLRQSRDAVEADVGQARDRGAGQDGGQREGLRIVERPNEVRLGGSGRKQVAECGADEEHHDDEHADSEHFVGPRTGFHAAEVQHREHRGEHCNPGRVGHARNEVHRDLAAVDRADHRVEHVVHDHAPSGDVAEARVQLLADVGECRPGAGVHARHSAVAHCRQQHGEHADQDRGDDVPACFLADDAEDAHRGNRLHEDDAVEDRVPQRQGSAEARGRGAHGSRPSPPSLKAPARPRRSAFGA